MADRAHGSKATDDAVFDLKNDADWQARLDEARALREIALAKKALGGPRRPRPKPWDAPEAQPALPPIEPMRENGRSRLDLHDRLEALKRDRTDATSGDDRPSGDDPRDNLDPASEPTIESLPSSADSIFEDESFQASDSEPEPVSLLLDPEEVAELPQAPRRPWLIEDGEAIDVDEATGQSVMAEPRERSVRKSLPFGLGAIVLAAVVTPFLVNGPGLDPAPVTGAAQSFGVQAALGLPSPFARWPRMTVPREWDPRRTDLKAPLLAKDPPGSIAALRDIQQLPALSEPVDTVGRVDWNSIAPIGVYSPMPPVPLATLPADETGLNWQRFGALRPVGRPKTNLLTPKR